MHVSPVLLDCNFTIDAGNTNGLGCKNLKGPAIFQVYCHSSAATPSSLNPASGSIVVQLTDNYNRNFNIVNACISSPNSGSDLTSTTAHTAYVITTLGSTTLAQWQAAGLPVGITPAVGVAFVATATGSIGGSGKVQIAAATGSGVASIEVLGLAQQTIAPDPTKAQGYGAYAILQCRDYAGAIVQPADGSLISLQFYQSNSSVTVSGE